MTIRAQYDHVTAGWLRYQAACALMDVLPPEVKVWSTAYDLLRDSIEVRLVTTRRGWRWQRWRSQVLRSAILALQEERAASAITVGWV